MTTPILKRELSEIVRDTVARQSIYDLHTHLYDKAFVELQSWGIDELLTYHYLIAETFRYGDISYDAFWALNKAQQAEVVWETLFVRNTPISEAARGVLTCLERLGIDTSEKDLSVIRAWYAQQSLEGFIDTVFEVGNIEAVVMTNNPFDPAEKPVWDQGVTLDPRFKAALRIDDLLLHWSAVYANLKEWGYDVGPSLNENTYAEVRRFLNDWIDRIDPVYFAASLPPDFLFPSDAECCRLLEHCVMPVGKARHIPFAMMIGVKRGVNPLLRMAGDGIGKSSVASLEAICAAYPDNKFMITMLSRENQHELCIAARKFRNLMLFGCWWFLNVPSMIRELTAMRIDLLGFSFIPQHSDARVTDQLIYKWSHSRIVIADVLIEKYQGILDAGWPVTAEDIRRDVAALFGGNFKKFIGQ